PRSPSFRRSPGVIVAHSRSLFRRWFVLSSGPQHGGETMVVASTRRCKLELMLLLLLVACGSDGMGPAASPAALRPWTSFATTGIPRTRTPDQSLRPDGWIPGSTGTRRAATQRRLRALAIARGFRPRRAQSNI